ncbi:MAG: rhamnan synthesis F family protein [Phyllobacterium sp.]
MRRLAIAFCYDPEGIVDDYYIHVIESLNEFSDYTLFVSNGELTQESRERVQSVADDVLIRGNTGFDVWAYKQALDYIGWDKLAEYDEVLLYNHTFYGPIFPLQELFSEMDQRKCDFWGISAHARVRGNPFDPQQSELPYHLNSHFIAVRKRMHQSPEFRAYWSNMPMINSYVDSIRYHETRFTKHFQGLGYKCAAYIDPEDYDSAYPVFLEVDRTLERRSPILKKRLFFNDTIFLESEAVNLPRALSIIEAQSNYDMNLVWKSVGRVSEPRVLNNNAALTSFFPDISIARSRGAESMRVAVCAHVYYEDMIDELLEYTSNISVPYDLIITTDTDAKKKFVTNAAENTAGVANLYVIVSESNEGRDTSSLLITCRDFFLNDKYDLVCRVHTKKSPQDGPKGSFFKRHTLDNILGSKGYVDNILEMFASNPHIGLSCPTLIHVGYPTMGHSWFTNKDNVDSLSRKLGLSVNLDNDTPVAPYGGMYWFRPKALRKLFDYPWKWEDFANQQYKDGSLPHAVERVIGYVAIDAGYTVQHVLTTKHASQNYVLLEAKLQALLSRIPLSDFRSYLHYVDANQHSAGNVNIGVRRSFKQLVYSMKRSLFHRSPVFFAMLRPFYRATTRIMRR